MRNRQPRKPFETAILSVGHTRRPEANSEAQPWRPITTSGGNTAAWILSIHLTISSFLVEQNGPPAIHTLHFPLDSLSLPRIVTMTEYRVDEEIAAFFSKATATREECHERAVALAGGSAVEPLKIQGPCSYTVYAGEGLESVV